MKLHLAIVLTCFSPLDFQISVIILKNAVESTTSGYCADSLRDCDDFLLHRMGDTSSAKNRHNLSKNQHINHSRYDSTAFFRLNLKNSIFALSLMASIITPSIAQSVL